MDRRDFYSLNADVRTWLIEALIKCHKLCFICADLSTCPPVYLSNRLPADHIHVEVCIKKTSKVPTCLPVYLPTMFMLNIVFTKLSIFRMSTCPPVYQPTMYMLNIVFTKLSMFRPVYLSICLPVHHVHVKVKICIYNTFHVPICQYVD